MNKPLKVAHLVSGGGTTMDNVARRMFNDQLGNIRPAVVIADRDCGALGKAKQLDISTCVITKAEFGSDWGKKILDVLQKHNTNIVFQNGWVPWTPETVINYYADRIYNQHPGFLSGDGTPDFGGKGMCGTAVTAARILYLLESGEDDREKMHTESTVHIVTNELDKGRVVRTERCNIASIIARCSTHNIVDALDAHHTKSVFDIRVGEAQSELLRIEHENVAAVLRDLALGKRTVVDNSAPAAALNLRILKRVKLAAIEMYPTK